MFPWGAWPHAIIIEIDIGDINPTDPGQRQLSKCGNDTSCRIDLCSEFGPVIIIHDSGHSLLSGDSNCLTLMLPFQVH